MKIEDKVTSYSRTTESKDLSQNKVLPASSAIIDENKQLLTEDLVSAKLIQLAKRIGTLKDSGKTEDASKLEKTLEEGMTKLVELSKKRVVDINPETVRENLSKLATEHVEQQKVLSKLQTLADKNLKREELDKELSKIPDLNREEALKIVARLDLERDANWQKGALGIVASKRKGEDEYKLDLSISLDRPVPGEDNGAKIHRERLLARKEERIEMLLEKYSDLVEKGSLTEEGIRSIYEKNRPAGLLDYYVRKSKDLPLSERIEEIKASKFFTKPEAERKFIHNFIKKELGETSNKIIQTSYEIGYFITPANKGDVECQSKVSRGQHERKSLKERLDKLAKDLPYDFLDREKVLGEIKQFNHKAVAVEVSGLTAFSKYKDGKEAEAKANYAKMVEEGGASFAVKEVFNKAGTELVHLSEWGVLNTVGVVASAVGLVTGQGYDVGANTVNDIREFYNKNTKSGSVFGNDEKFSGMTNWELGLEVSAWGGVSHLAGGVISPALDLVDIGRVEISRRRDLKELLMPGAVLTLDLIYGVDGKDVKDLSYQQYRNLEQTDSLLKTAKYSFQVAEIAGSLALGQPKSIGALAKNLSVSGGMGVGSAISTQLMAMDDEIVLADGTKTTKGFEVGKFLEDTLANTAGSQLFSGAMMAGSSVWMKARAGGVLNKINQGATVTSEEIAHLTKTIDQTQKARGVIDFLDGQSDLKNAALNFQNVKGIYSLAGALGSATVASADSFDVNLGIGDAIQRGLDGKIEHNQKKEETQAPVPPSVPSLEGETLKSLTVNNTEKLDVLSSLSFRGHLSSAKGDVESQIDPTVAVTGQLLMDDMEVDKRKIVKDNKSELKFEPTTEKTNTLARKDVPLSALKINGNEYLGFFSGNREVFYLQNRSELPALYDDILESRREKDSSGSEDVRSFIDKESKLIFSYLAAERESREDLLLRSEFLAHENQHLQDLEQGKEVNEEKAYLAQERFQGGSSRDYDLSRYDGASILSLAAVRNRGSYHSGMGITLRHAILDVLEDPSIVANREFKGRIEVARSEDFESTILERIEPDQQTRIINEILNKPVQDQIKTIKAMQALSMEYHSIEKKLDPDYFSSERYDIVLLLANLLEKKDLSPIVRFYVRSNLSRNFIEDYYLSYKGTKVNPKGDIDLHFGPSPFYPDQVNESGTVLRRLASDLVCTTAEGGTPTGFIRAQNISEVPKVLSLVSSNLTKISREIQKAERGEIKVAHAISQVCTDLYLHLRIAGYTDVAADEFLINMLGDDLYEQLSGEVLSALLEANYKLESDFRNSVGTGRDLRMVNFSLGFSPEHNPNTDLPGFRRAILDAELKYNKSGEYDLYSETLRDLGFESDFLKIYNHQSLEEFDNLRDAQQVLSKLRSFIDQLLEERKEEKKKVTEPFIALATNSTIFPSEGTSHLEVYKLLAQPDVRADLESELGIDLSKLSFRAQVHFLPILLDSNQYLQLRETLSSLPSQDNFRELFLEAFFGVSVEPALGKRLVEIVQKNNAGDVRLLLNKYLEILNGISEVANSSLQQDQREAVRAFLLRANRVLLGNVNIESVVGNLDAFRREILVAGISLEASARSENTTFSDLEKAGLSMTTGSAKDLNELLPMMREGSGVYPSLTLQYYVVDKFQDKLKDENTRLHVVRYQGAPVFFAICEDTPTGISIGSVTTNPLAQAFGLGKHFMKEMMDRELARNPERDFELTCWDGNIGALKMYKQLGFETVPSTPTELQEMLYPALPSSWMEVSPPAWVRDCQLVAMRRNHVFYTSK